MTRHTKGYKPYKANGDWYTTPLTFAESDRTALLIAVLLATLSFLFLVHENETQIVIQHGYKTSQDFKLISKRLNIDK